jgi:hypothetical protein
MKPDFAAPDGVNTTFFGTDIPGDPDAYPNFFGSSAAAPQAAGLAALMLDANPQLTSSELVEILHSTARDIESAGWDAQSGDGLIDALDAVTMSRPVSSIGPSTHQFGVVGVADTVSQIFSLSNDTSGPALLWVSAFNLSDATSFGLDTTKGPDPCGSQTPILAPGDSCTFEVSFTPVATGSYSESLEVSTNGPATQISFDGSSIHPATTVTVSPTPSLVSEPGGEVTFSVQVRNDSASTDPITINSLTESTVGSLHGMGTCTLPQPIQPGATYQCSYTASVLGNAGAAESHQVATAGLDDDGQAVDGDGSTLVTIANSAPSLNANLSVDPSVVTEPGAWVTFSLEVENVSASVDPVTIQSIIDDSYGDVTEASNPLIADTTCQLGLVVEAGETYSCSYRGEVSGGAGQTPTHEVSVSGQDDESSSANAADTVAVTVQALALFRDGYESGDTSVWSSVSP